MGAIFAVVTLNISFVRAKTPGLNHSRSIPTFEIFMPIWMLVFSASVKLLKADEEELFLDEYPQNQNPMPDVETLEDAEEEVS